VADQLLKFLVQHAPVRGEVVRLDRAWQQMMAAHDYPPAVVRLLGEATVAAALLSSNIKFNGALVLQIHGDGPVPLLMVECQSDLRLRATAKLAPGAVVPEDADWQALVNAHGRGRCAIMLDPRDRRPGQAPYQGVVPLAGAGIAAAIEAYMRQSEQLDTRLWLASDAAAAAGVLLQRLPDHGGAAGHAVQDADAWDRVNHLAGTLQAAELLTTEPATLVRRLFWQESLEHYAPLTPRFECVCSRARVGRMLVALGRAEVDAIVAEQGRVDVTCDFCNTHQVFDAVDVAHLFTTGATLTVAGSTPH